MKRLATFAALLMLLISAVRSAHAESRLIQIWIESDPPHAAVRDSSGEELGWTGQNVSLDLSRYPNVTSLTFTLTRDGYHPVHVTIPIDDEVKRHGYHSNDVHRMEADNAWVALQTWIGQSKGLLLVLALILAGVCYLVLRRRRELQRQLHRGAVLEGLQAARANTTNPLVLAKIGGYRLIDLLGKGGMAMVYRAVSDQDLDQSQAVAVKVLDADASSDAAFRARFKKEVNASKSLLHASIVKMIDWGEENGLLYLVMELVEGDMLRRHIRPDMPYARINRLLEGLISGLAYAHERGIIHRDLKPENIMVTGDDRIKIMDFGLARQEASTLTVDSKVLGTPSYMAPEQIEGERTDARTDQYSLGIMIYELVCCARPFEGDYVETIIHKHLSEPPPPMTGYRKDVPEGLQAAVFRMMAKQPDDRFASVAEAWEAVHAALASVV